MAAELLIVDDDAALTELMVAVLSGEGVAVTATTSPDDALALLAAHDFDVVVTDLRMRGIDGLELCSRIVASRPEIPVIVVTAFGSMETAVGALRAGAWDFLTKPFDNDVLALTVARALRHRALREEVQRLRREVATVDHYEGIVGASPAMRAVYDLLDRVASSDVTALVTGESGTGKEIVARALHARSPRAAGPFVAINCAAMPETLLESELFGHVKGAFTDARSGRKGLFLQADHGTLLLDEVGELPLTLQPKLLRALQERRIRPLGGDVEVPFNARIIAATNRDLESAVDARTFREDLFYRLNVIRVPLPPLRARGNDVLVLAQQFVVRAATRSSRPVTGISPEAAEKLLNYAWPGNVRELENAMEHAVALARATTVRVDDLPEKIRAYKRSHVVVAADDPQDLVSLEELERRYIPRVMEAVGGNKTLAARILGVDRTTLYRKLEGATGKPDDD